MATEEEIRRKRFGLPKKTGDPQSITGADPAGTTFKGIVDPLKTAGIETAREGLAELAPSQELRPETLRILEQIRAESDISREKGVSLARATAEKSGITGSSIERFGVGQAIGETERARLAAENPILQQNLAHEQNLQVLRAEGLFGIGQMEASNAQAVAQLTSDELASIRNLQEAGKDRELQLYLGERGIQVSRENIAAAERNAKKARDAQIVSSITQAVGTVAIFPF